MLLHRASLAALMTLALTACGGGEEAADEESGNRVAVAEAESSGSEASGTASEPEPAARAVVDPLGFQALIGYLPEPRDGFSGAEPKGSTTSLPDYKVTVVSRDYSKAGAEGEPQSSITIQITDGGFSEAVSAPFQMMSMMSHESTEGYQKGVTIGGQPGYETWDNGSRRTELNVLVGGRFMLQLSGSQVEPEALRAWAESIDLSGLADQG
jgi:hypothetical protein